MEGTPALTSTGQSATGQSATGQSVETVIDNGSLRHAAPFASRPGCWPSQAAGSAVAAYLDDETMLLSAPRPPSKNPKDHFDFFPLTIDVEERMYAAGRIPGSFFRREGRPSPRTPSSPAGSSTGRCAQPSSQGPAQRGPGRRHRDGAATPTRRTTCWPSTRRRCRPRLSGLPFSGPVGGDPGRADRRPVGGLPRPTASSRRQLRHGRRRPHPPRRRDVAIMMVEAESTEATWELVRAGKQAPTEEVVAEGLEAAKAVHQAAVRGAGGSSPQAGQAGRGVPGLPRLRGRRVRRGRRRRPATMRSPRR